VLIANEKNRTDVKKGGEVVPHDDAQEGGVENGQPNGIVVGAKGSPERVKETWGSVNIVRKKKENNLMPEFFKLCPVQCIEGGPGLLTPKKGGKQEVGQRDTVEPGQKDGLYIREVFFGCETFWA